MRRIGRLIGYSAASLGSLLLIGFLIALNWWLAWPNFAAKSFQELYKSSRPTQLRWHMVTKNRIAKGTQIRADDVSWTLGRLPQNAPWISMSKPVVGKYALCDIEANSTFIPDILSDLAPAEPPSGGVVLPVQVSTADVSSLKPGMHLAFAQEKVVQPQTTLLSRKNQPGLVLLSMTTSAKDEGQTTLFVEITRNDLQSVPFLTNGTWRPIILGNNEPVPKPPPPPRSKRCRPRKA